MSFGYAKWRAQCIQELNAASEVVETACGAVEFSREGAAPYVLQFHGTPGGHDAGAAMGAAFAEAGYGLITLSRPGYLRTPMSSGRTMAEQADAAAALLDALEVGQVAAHGVSGGGPASAQFAARHPDRAAVLLLTCAISAGFAPEVPKLAGLILSRTGMRLSGWLMRRFPRMALRQMVSTESTLSPAECRREAERIVRSPEMLDWVSELSGSAAPWEDRSDGFHNDMAQFREIEASPLPLEQIRCPAFILHGTADGDVPFSHAEQAHRRIPNATLHAPEGVWHLLWVCEGAAAMARAQVDFLQAHLPPASRT